MSKIKKKVIIIGAGRHGILIAEKVLENKALALEGFIDQPSTVLPPFLSEKGYLIVGTDEDMVHYKKSSFFHLALGGDLIKVRQKIIKKIEDDNYKVTEIVHPSSYISPSARLGKGCAVLVNAVVHTGAAIGDFSCINTAAVVEHDCRVGKNVFIQPGAVLSGSVIVGDNTSIGVGASVRQNIRIGVNCVIGGGAFVCEDIPDNSIAYGVPAKVVGPNTL